MNNNKTVTKDAQIHIRLNGDDKSAIANLAREESMNISEFLLFLARSHDGFREARISVKKNGHADAA